MTSLPLVSCIMPTCDRRAFAARAVTYYLRQDYANRELVVVDDGSERVDDLLPSSASIRYVRAEQRATVGAKRNLACRMARGDLILHWDDDDWYASNRISIQVAALLDADAEVCGLRQMLFYHSQAEETWLYEYPAEERRWLIGGSLLYRKTFWQRRPFPNILVGEDTRFLWSQPLDRAVALPDYRFYVAMIHAQNTSRKETRGVYWQRWTGDLRTVMGDDLDSYRAISTARKVEPPSMPAAPVRASAGAAPAVSAPAPNPAEAQEQTAARYGVHPGNPLASVPRVSCILATGSRREFTRQAIRCFLRQTLEDSELIVVDDGEEPAADLCDGLLRVRYIRLNRPTLLGTKLNIGIRCARGQIIQKLDDDDYYHPGFLERATAELPSDARSGGISAWDCFLVLLAGIPQLRFSGHGWAAGGTLCFHKRLWEQTPFRDLPREVDGWFLRDHRTQVARICAPEMYILLRHGRNTWTETNHVNVDAYFSARPADPRPIEALVEPLDVEFYRSFITQGAMA